MAETATAETLLDNQQQRQEGRERRTADQKKRLAEQQKRHQEEEANKWKRLQMKAELIAKNQEEIRHAREVERMKKKELREMKFAENNARRKKLEDSKLKRRSMELLHEEQHRGELLQRYQETEQKKRDQARLERERVEKEKLRQYVESKTHEWERLKQEFVVNEKHRNNVENKKKQEREDRERVKFLQSERQRQADDLIAGAFGHIKSKPHARTAETGKRIRCNHRSKSVEPNM